MNPTLIRHLDTMRRYTSLVSKGILPDVAYSLTFDCMIDTKNYRKQLGYIHQDIEADLRTLLYDLKVDKIMKTALWDASFNIPYGCNRLISITRKQDWIFEFTDSNNDLPVRYELGELSIENKLVLIDLLQKS